MKKPCRRTRDWCDWITNARTPDSSLSCTYDPMLVSWLYSRFQYTFYVVLGMCIQCFVVRTMKIPKPLTSNRTPASTQTTTGSSPCLCRFCWISDHRQPPEGSSLDYSCYCNWSLLLQLESRPRPELLRGRYRSVYPSTFPVFSTWGI